MSNRLDNLKNVDFSDYLLARSCFFAKNRNFDLLLLNDKFKLYNQLKVFRTRLITFKIVCYGQKFRCKKRSEKGTN